MLLMSGLQVELLSKFLEKEKKYVMITSSKA